MGVFCLVFGVLGLVSTAYSHGAQGSRGFSNPCMDQSTCGACVAAGQDCAWCKQEPFDGERCDTLYNLDINGCDVDQVVGPDHLLIYNQNLPPRNADLEQTLEPIQLSPQEVTVKLRPNKPFKLPVTFRYAENYPVDLYYLMDLSYSMKDDKEKLASLGHDIAAGMSQITNNFRLGFGSFVDKKTMPYVSTVPRKLTEPCQECAAPYGFKNHLSLHESSADLFEEKVAAAQISGNLDSLEGGFDAIMQSIVCHEEIGWRNSSRKMLVFSTDAGFHYAGDGKLGGIVKPNDEHCHMENGFYSESLNQDYPSIGQLAHKIKDGNVNVIFAVTDIRLYWRLSQFIEGSAVGELASDSSNIVELVRQNYARITSKVELKKRGVDDRDIFVTFRTKCGSEEWEESSSCPGLYIGQSVTFEVTMEAKSCPKLREQWVDSFEVYPVGLTEKLKINYELMCECDCENSMYDEDNSPQCSMAGTYECGACTCDRGHFGKFCQCDGSSLASDYDAGCKMTNASRVCEENGECVCGLCDCFPIQSGGDMVKYRGRYCECDDFSCDRHQNKLCSGPDHGRCECGACVCLPGFIGDDCSCPTAMDTCMAKDGQGPLCNGKGRCECGACICEDTLYKGRTCEDCDACPGKCDEHKACVQCTAFHTGPHDANHCQTMCSHVTIVEEINRSNDEQKKVCRLRDEDRCFYSFTYEYETDEVEVQLKKECPDDDDVLAIVLGIVIAILLIGLIVLLVWKIVVSLHDTREFAKFERERQSARWDMGENPLYRQATTTFKNPTYGQYY